MIFEKIGPCCQGERVGFPLLMITTRLMTSTAFRPISGSERLHQPPVWLLNTDGPSSTMYTLDTYIHLSYFILFILLHPHYWGKQAYKST